MGLDQASEYRLNAVACLVARMSGRNGFDNSLKMNK